MKPKFSTEHPVGFLTQFNEDHTVQVFMAGAAKITPPDMVLDEIERLWLKPGNLSLNSIKKMMIITPQKNKSMVAINDNFSIFGEVSKFRINFTDVYVNKEMTFDDFIGFDKIDLSFMPLDAGFLMLFKDNDGFNMYLDFIPNAYELDRQELQERRKLNEKQVASYISQIIWHIDNESAKKKLINDGWFFGYSMPHSLYHKVVELYELEEREIAKNKIKDYFSENVIKEMLDAWANNEHFKNVRHLLEEGIQNYIDQRYVSSIHVLLPYLEGIAARAMGIIGKSTDSISRLLKTRVDFNNGLYLQMWRDYQKYINGYLFKDFKWGEESPFSRHSTLHGARTNFEWFHALQTIIGLNELYYYLTYFKLV